MTTTLRLLMRSFTAQATCAGRLPVSRRNFSSSATPEAKAEINERKEKYVRESLEFLQSGEKDTSQSSEALLMNIKSKLGMEDNADGMKDDLAYLKRAMEVLLLINRVDPVTLQPPLTRTEDV
ncbi:unnamed protein product [Microthlaspi erraticum]|uniref:Uncharacterized protein n=1 Tax=Microthlaspi erraticum TaxID=1685480 RepID=A0A6D2IA04_9BRAS|nr:unnamed protein product [Microthlaspi erraticum]